MVTFHWPKQISWHIWLQGGKECWQGHVHERGKPMPVNGLTVMTFHRQTDRQTEWDKEGSHVCRVWGPQISQSFWEKAEKSPSGFGGVHTVGFHSQTPCFLLLSFCLPPQSQLMRTFLSLEQELVWGPLSLTTSRLLLGQFYKSPRHLDIFISEQSQGGLAAPGVTLVPCWGVCGGSLLLWASLSLVAFAFLPVDCLLSY